MSFSKSIDGEILQKFFFNERERLYAVCQEYWIENFNCI